MSSRAASTQGPSCTHLQLVELEHQSDVGARVSKLSPLATSSTPAMSDARDQFLRRGGDLGEHVFDAARRGGDRANSAIRSQVVVSYSS